MSRVRRLRASLVTIAVLAALLGATASAQAASPWTITNLNLGENETIFGLSCEASGFCVGVGGEAVLIQSTSPTGGAGAWTIGHVTPAEGLQGNLRDVSCPSPSLCVAVDYSGGVWTTTDPRAGPGSWQPTKIPKAKSLFDVSCPTSSQCIVVGAAGLVATTSNPTGGGGWHLFHLSEEQPLRSLACAGALCVAGDYEGGVWTTTDAAGGPAAWISAGRPGGESPSLGLTCQSEALCLVGQAGTLLVSSNPTAGTSAWVPTPLARRFQIFAASCPSAGLCALSSNNGEVYVSTNPLGGAPTWRTEYLIGGDTNAMFGLSCPTENLCVAAGKFGQMLTTTNPRATGLPESAPPPPTPPLPPTTLLLQAPRKTIRLGARTPLPMVNFRFGAQGEATSYSCRMDGNLAGRCNAMKSYRVGAGRHTFRVIASGPGGTGNTVAYRFRIIRAKP